jgi:hypothetical protein
MVTDNIRDFDRVSVFEIQAIFCTHHETKKIYSEQ